MTLMKKSICISTALLFLMLSCMPAPVAAITLAEEEELAREFMAQVNKRFDLIKDPYIVDYVNSVGRKILDNLPPQPFAYRFYVIDSDVYNAFATPAGHIFIYRGLIEAMDSEDELAGILGHEIGHVQCRHISDKIERSSKLNVAALAGLAAGIFLGVGGAGEAAQAVTVGSMAAAQTMALAYSREDEIQADKVGLENISRAGYDGTALMTTLDKIRAKRWFDNIPTYLTTHPAAEDRIAYIDAWSQNHPNTQPKGATQAFQKTQTRLLALYGDEEKALERFEKWVRNNPEDPLAHYGYGLILARTGNRKEAASQLEVALEKDPLDSSLLGELGRVYFLDGRLEEALSTLQGSRGLSGNNPDTQFYLGRTQMELGHYQQATESLTDLVKNNSDYDQAYYFLGESYGKLGNLGEAHYNLGIYYAKKQEPKNAVFHLQKALETTSDPYLKEKVEKMLADARKAREKHMKDEQAQQRNMR